jgi:hypothetical protein
MEGPRDVESAEGQVCLWKYGSRIFGSSSQYIHIVGLRCDMVVQRLSKAQPCLVASFHQWLLDTSDEQGKLRAAPVWQATSWVGSSLVLGAGLSPSDLLTCVTACMVLR